MKNDILWLADQIQEFADAGQWNDQHWYNIFDQIPPTGDSHRNRVLFGPLLLDGRAGLRFLNPAVCQALQAARMANCDRACDALSKAGVSAVAAEEFRRIGPHRELIVELAAMVKRRGTKADGQPACRVLADTLWSEKNGRKRGPYAKPEFTELQAEAMQQLGIYKTKSAAARAMGISRGAFDKHYRAACQKLGKLAAKKNPRTEQYHNDHRGQAALTHDHRKD